MTNIAIIAHNVSTPLYKHRSKEFSERIYFMAKRFNEIHIISREGNINNKDKISIKDELASNLIVHKVSNDFIFSNLDILRVVRSIKADVMFADGIDDGANSLLCKNRCKIPLITFIQGYEADLKAIAVKQKFRIKPTPGLLSNVFALHDSIVLRASDKILCVSPGLVSYARSLIPRKDWDKIKFIPHSLQYVRHISGKAIAWANDFIGSLKIGNDQKFLLLMTVGTGPLKGTDIALKSYKYISKRNPNAVMIVVGKTIDSRYINMARELGFKNNVLFLQNLPRDYVLALLSHSSIFLCPSFSEGFSWAVAEAMALGVPVIAYANKSLINVANRGVAVVVKTTDPKDYAKECISLIMDQERRQNLIEKAKRYIAPYVNFSEEDRFKLIATYIEKAYEEWRMR
jgi:glycosyltransferase involved in cell wall biosynthesis